MIIGYFNLNFIIIPILVSTVKAEKKVWTINSTPASCNGNEILTRAVGANFSAAIIATCKNLDDYSCDVAYTYTHKDAGLETSKISITKESPTTVSANLNIRNIEAQVRYNFTKTSNIFHQTILYFTIIPPSDEEVNLTLNTANLCRGTLATVNFVGCKNETEFRVKLHNSRIARYLDEGTIICDKFEKGRAVFNNNSEALQTQCLDDATWRYASNITCLYPIAAELHLNDKPYTKTIDLEFDQSSNASNEAFVLCLRYDGGPGESISVVILHQKEMEMNVTSSIINLHPNMNGESVSCYFKNRYTTLFDPYLSTSILNISFGPYPPTGFQSLCYFKNGSIKFYSNPASTESGLSLWQGENEKIPVTITECCETNYGVFGQLITPNMLITGADLRLRRNYSGRIEHLNVTPCPRVTTTTPVIGITFGTNSYSSSTQDVQDAKPEDSTMFVILVIGSAMLLITISLIKYLCWRRRNKEKPITGGDKATLDKEVQRNYPAGVYEEVNPMPTEPVGNHHEYMYVVPVTTSDGSIQENTFLTETKGYQTVTFTTNRSIYEDVLTS